MTKLLLPLIIITVVLIGIVGFRQLQKMPYSQLPSPSPSPTEKIFKNFESSTLKFKINIPYKSEVEEKATRVTIKFPNSDASIIINRGATNFGNLNDYVNNSQNNLKETIKDKNDFKINDLEALSGYTNNSKSYFIYVDNWIYIISTDSSPLYPDLDQIAQSFRYIP